MIYKFLLAAIVIISIFLRFSKAPDLFVFSADEEHQLSISQTIVSNFHIEWVGVSSADTGFYLGPFWQYFGAFWLFISKGDPVIVAYVAAGIGVVTTILVYLVGKLFFGKFIGLLASLLYATLPLLVYYDRKFWNPALTSFVSLSLLLSLYKTKDNQWWWVIVALLYGFVFHVHVSLIPLLVVIVYWFWKQKERIQKRVVVVGAAVFLLVISPLIGFDYFHKLSNLKAPLRMIKAVSNNPLKFNPEKNFTQFFRSMGRLWYLYPGGSNSDEVLHDCSPYFNKSGLHKVGTTTTFSDNIPILSLFSIFLLMWFVFRRSTWTKLTTKLLGLFLLTIIISYLLLPNTPLEYYLLGVFPLLLFIPGLLYEKLVNKKAKNLFFVVLMILSFLGINTVIKANGEYGLSAKRQLIKKVMGVVGSAPYELDATGLCHKYEGWRFLFKAYGKVPVKSYSDTMFGWLYKDEISNQKAKYQVVVSEARIFYTQQPDIIATVTSGGFKAYIFKAN